MATLFWLGMALGALVVMAIGLRVGVTLPWDCHRPDYPPQDGMSSPIVGEVAWVRPEGRKAYSFGHVKKLRSEFLP